MMLPTGHALFSNLSTSFTDFDGLLAELEAGAVSGYVRVAFPGYDAVVLLDGGRVARSFEEQGEDETADIAVAAVATHARNKGGHLSVYPLEPRFVAFLAGMARSSVLHRGLSTVFANPDRLLNKLREDHHTGHLSVALDGGRGAGVVFLQDGEIVEAVLKNDTQSVSGIEVAEMVVQAAANYGASFSVFEVDRVALRSGEIDSAEDFLANVASVPEHLFHKGPASDGREQPSAPDSDVNKTDILNFWSEVFSRAEGVVDGLSQAGRFSTAFKEVLVEKAGTYPYLDPFAADFSYGDGMATFGGELPGDLSEALGDCLHDTLARLAFRLRRADIETRVHASLAELGERHVEMISHLSPSTQALVS